jgi:uncharacterized repeat protein (TIGR03943 family)
VRLDRRLAAAAVLAVWAGFFVWLRASGEQDRYVGTRTSWVVLFGAVALTAVALGSVLAVLARRRGSRVRPGELVGLLIILLPVIGVLAVPNPQLGAYAAAHKLSSARVELKGDAGGPLQGDRGFLFLAISNVGEEERARFGVVPGLPVKFAGIVTGKQEERKTIELTRFAVICCAADAVPYKVEVLEDGFSPELIKNDQWVGVIGEVTQAGDKLVVRPTSTIRLPAPSSPYLRY